MSILTDDEMPELFAPLFYGKLSKADQKAWKEHVQAYARAIEAAVLAKLAQKAAPVPAVPDHFVDVNKMVPKGWKLVPVEPTPEMLMAMRVRPDFCGQHIIKHSVDKLPEAYAAMLAAAPKAPKAD